MNARMMSLASLLALSLVAGGCSGDANGDESSEDDEDDSALTSGNGPAPLRNQRVGCDGADLRNTSVGPFGTCREVLLPRAMEPPTTDAQGRAVPARPSVPADWLASNMQVPLPTHKFASSDFQEVEITNLETGRRQVKHPIIGMPLSFYLGPQGHLGMQVVLGKNRFVYKLTPKAGPNAGPPLIYKFTTTFRKKPS